MTRFHMEISGKLGDWWKNYAEKEVIRKVEYAKEKAIVEADGAIKWISNGNYIPDDYCEQLEYAGYSFSRKATERKRDIQNTTALEEYRKVMEDHRPSEEELLEMKAAFGEGETIIDILTGAKYAL